MAGRLKSLVLNPKPKRYVRCGLKRLVMPVLNEDPSYLDPEIVKPIEETQTSGEAKLEIEINL